jgi:hypothetical protein
MIGFTLGFNVNSWIVGVAGMSTTVTELGWQAAVAVVRASLPRRGIGDVLLGLHAEAAGSQARPSSRR